MTRVFFSHASEDKAIVEAVYHEFVTAYPDYKPWVDKYEIVGGDSLIKKIADGMDAADKFFIFLSSTAVKKPWVQKELRRALMREIEDVDPNFIIPIKIGDLERIPAFLEDKLYIDLQRLTKPEWLAQLDASITGEPKRPESGAGKDNVEVTAEQGESPNIALIHFKALAWAEKFEWALQTTEDIVNCTVEGAGVFFDEIRSVEGRIALFKFSSPELRPGHPLWLRVEFAPGVDALKSIDVVERWSTIRNMILEQEAGSK